MSDALLIVSSQKIVAALCPEWGGRVAWLTYDGVDILHPMPMAQGYNPENWPRGGAYPLIPFHNRIRGGRFEWLGRTYDVGTHYSEPNALHGPACRPAWAAQRVSEAEVRLVLDWAPQASWPFAFRAAQHFTVQDAALHVRLSVENTGNAPMPAGLGWHPYFAKCTRIHVQAARDWVLDDGYFPTGEWQAAGEALPTRYLTDWRDLALTMAGGMRVHIEADALFSQLVIHDPAEAYSCVEPVSHLAGALNLLHARQEDAMHTLLPSEVLVGDVTVSVVAE